MNPSPPRINRRLFLLSILLAGMIGWLNWPALRALRRRLVYGPSHPLLGLLADPNDGVRLGQEYLRAYPHEADFAGLPGLILPGGAAPWPSSSELLSAFRQQVERDWEADEVVDIHRWILTRTEGRLFAFCALWQNL